MKNESLVAYRTAFINTGVGKHMLAAADRTYKIQVPINGIEGAGMTLVFLYNENEEDNKPLLNEASLNYVRNEESGRWVQTIMYVNLKDVADELNAGNFIPGIAACPRRAQYMAFMEANHASAFPPKKEGFWRPSLNLPTGETSVSQEEWKLPFPVVYEPLGYDKNLFLSLLSEMEDSPFTKREVYRGISLNRITGKANGNSEYERDGWRWPSGYINYIRMGVPPSRDFYLFVTTQYCPSLPNYLPVEKRNEPA